MKGLVTEQRLVLLRQLKIENLSFYELSFFDITITARE